MSQLAGEAAWKVLTSGQESGQTSILHDPSRVVSAESYVPPARDPVRAERAASAGVQEECGSAGDLLHRGSALAVADECRARLESGRPVTVIIEGDRGSGKSALLRAITDRCGAEVVLRARCHGAERGFSFGVAGQLIDRLSVDHAGAQAAVVPDTGTQEFGERDQYRLFHQLYQVVRAVTAQGPVVLAIDDIHLADPLSVQWCSYVTRRLDDVPVAVLVTAGHGDGAECEPRLETNGLLADLGALAHCRVLQTGPLCEACAETLLTRCLGRPVEPDFARLCHATARGNPQIIGAVAARLAGAEDAAQGTAVELTAQALASAAVRWLRQDNPVEARVAEQFAVCGGGSLETAAMLVGQGEDVARAARAMLRRLGLLEATAPDRLAHPAMAEVMASLVPPLERAAMHAHAATLLAQIGDSAESAAEHAMLAGTIGEPWARRLLRQAAREAAASGDWPRGARYLGRALLEPGAPRHTLAITAELAMLHIHHDVSASLRRAAVAADLAADDPDSAAALAVFAHITLVAEDGPTAAAFCRAAAELAAAAAPERHALLRLAASALLSGQVLPPELAAGVLRATRLLARGPADAAARQMHSALAVSTAARGRARGRCRALALRSAVGSPLTSADPVPSILACAALALTWVGELDAASDTCAQAIEAAYHMASRTGEAVALLVRSEIAFQRGNLTAALNDAHQALQLFEAVGATGLRAAAAAALTRVRLLRGEPGALPARAASPRAFGHPFILALQQEARGLTAAAQGNQALALRRYLECGRHLMAAGIVNPACSAWRSRAVTVLAELDRGWEARTLADGEIILARAWGAPGPLGRALVAGAAAYEGPARRELLREAVSVLEGSGYRVELARALIELGCELRADATEPSRVARETLERGLDLAMDCGAMALVAAAPQLRTGEHGRGHEEATPLTGAERRVAELVVAGLSNQAVADKLVLSKRTVDTHLGRIYRKLGITGRARLREAMADPGPG
jgi:DNA-binding CsgD family transcriptional regulator